MKTAKPQVSRLTPPGEGGIAVIGLGGPGAGELLERHFRARRGRGGVSPDAIAYGHLVRGETVLDEVIVARPTGEELYEINCHGGPAAVRAVMGCLEAAGAEAVPWQEFTAHERTAPPLAGSSIRRAARRALPRSTTRLAARMLLRQMAGALEDALRDAWSEIRQGSPAGLDTLLDCAPAGMALLRPRRVLLAGPPNVGKSTLLNALLHRERVIVHHRPGTTRDVVRETVSIGGIPFELMDSAGMRAGAREVERRAMERVAELSGECEVLVLLYDVRRGPGPTLEEMPALHFPERTLVVGNKVDLLEGETAPGPLGGRLEGSPHLLISARDGQGVENLERALVEPLREVRGMVERGAAVVFTRRQAEALRSVEESLRRDGPEAALGRMRELRGES